MRVTVAVAVMAAAVGAVLGAFVFRPAASPLDVERQEGGVVATYVGRTMKTGAVEAQLRAQPQAVRERFASDEGRKDYVEGLVRLDLLAHLAVEKGYDREPDFVRRLKQELASAYLEKEFEEPQRKAAPTDEEIRQYFEANLPKIQRPERLRLAVVAFRAEDDATREHKRSFARAALAEARRASRPRTPAAPGSTAAPGASACRSRRSASSASTRTAPTRAASAARATR